MSASSTGHQGLYPIIRRIRRPLLPPDPPVESKPPARDSAEGSVPAAANALEVADETKTDASDSNK
jgi:hypothetical protein